ncbi:MAG: hypothetical protein ACOVJ8_01020 [Sediminibacterium sp.]
MRIVRVGGGGSNPTFKTQNTTDLFSVVGAPNPFDDGFQLKLTTPFTGNIQVQLFTV